MLYSSIFHLLLPMNVPTYDQLASFFSKVASSFLTIMTLIFLTNSQLVHESMNHEMNVMEGRNEC